MLINLAQFLKEPPGSVRQVAVSEEVSWADTGDWLPVGPLAGSLTLSRTNRGVYLEGEVSVPVRLTCCRCLDEFPTQLEFELQEECLPTVDIATGSRIEVSEAEVVLLINRRHELDLREVLRQYAVLNVPMMPLCSEECRGLCLGCGVNRNHAECGCGSLVEDSDAGD